MPTQPPPSAETRGQDLERIVTKVCSARLVFLCLLLIPLAMAWLGEADAHHYFSYFSYPVFPLFLVVGFGVNIVFLLSWRRFKDIVQFFRVQLLTDTLLAAVLVLLTGGLTSGFVFLFWGLVFLYGRVLGLNTGKVVAAAAAALMFLTGALQYRFPALWNQPGFELEQLAYSMMLQLLALGLVLVLLKLGRGEEERLLRSLAMKEQALQESEALKRGVFDWMESGLIVCDPAGNITAINAQGARWGGLASSQEAIGRPLERVFPEIAAVWREHPERRIDRTEVEKSSGEGIYGLRISPIPEERGVLIIFTDITRVRRLESRLHQVEKLASIGELAAGLAHEIKNPLAGIKGSLQLIRGKDLEPEQEERLHQVVKRDVQRLDHLLTDFLAFARPSLADPRAIDVLAVVEECLGALRATYPTVRFTVMPGQTGTTWQWDRDQLKQVLLNLLLNAVQAAESAGQPLVEVELTSDTANEYLAIRDNGPGVDPDKTQSLFDPFVTTKPKGSGLGLSIARRLASQNSSWVELGNRPGGGAEARLYKG